MTLTTRTDKKDAKFLEALAEGVPVGKALPAGYGRQSVYTWRKDDPDFRQAWEDAIATHTESMETEADRRGIDGTLKPIYYRGEVCGEVREYSDTLLIFRLKAEAPDKYRENIRQEVTGKDGVPLAPPITQVEIIMPADPS